MGKKEEQPPSLFDNLDMFAAKPVEKKVKEKPSSKKRGEDAASTAFFSAGFAANMSRLSNRLGGCSSFFPIEL